ncbi:MAG: FHA domain-containing protein [Anaerolineales bacterium]|nr:FHA domain-containing protein [Anaerolineales bacterium]
MNPVLEIQYPDGRKETLQMTRARMIVGRGNDVDIQIKDSRISRHHAAIEHDDGRVYVIDLGGSNGTWVGKSKLLANVREPFPEDATVHIGPAQVRRVPASARQIGDLESNVYQPIEPQRSGGRGGYDGGQQGGYAGSGGQQGGYAGGQQGGSGGQQGAGRAGTRSSGSTAYVELSQSQIQVGPGERTSTQMVISNQGKVVEHYKVVVNGVPASWVTLPPRGLELLPRQEGSLNLDFHPPRSSRTSAGSHPITILVMNQAGQVVAETSTNIEVRAFDQLSLDLRPDPFQSRMGGSMTLTVENMGNARTDYRVDALEASDSLEIYVDPPNGTLAPQQKRQNIIHLRPRRRIWVGQPRRLPINVSVSSNLASAEAMPTYTQLATIPRWLPIVMALACCVILPFLIIGGYPILWPPMEARFFPTETPIPTATPEHTPTSTPNFDATATASRNAWCEQDDDQDRLLNCRELEIGTDPFLKDTDDDGLSDFAEESQIGTSPIDRDSDGDELLDGFESEHFCLSPVNKDTDNDGIPDNIDEDPCGGVTPTTTPRSGFGIGGHARNGIDDDAVSAMQSARMQWVKVQVRYSIGADGVSAGADLNAWKQEGFKLLVSVVGHREEVYRSGYFGEYARFAADVVTTADADAIEIWNEPNIDVEWPTGQINPGDYTRLVNVTASAVRSARPGTLIISAGLAPNGVPVGDGVWPDNMYLQGMVAAGIKLDVDCIGVHHNQGATPPNETSGHPTGNSHYSFYWRGLVDTYWDIVNPPDTAPAQEVPLCFTEVGYLTDDGFDDSIEQRAPNFSWAANNSLFEQGEWLEDTVLRSCRERKTLLVIVWNVNFTGDLGQDPQAGYAIIRPDDSCPSCERLANAIITLVSEGCMNVDL